jgi:polar amino acid transport system substrate-binding protein/glutamate/aspartate transport system substrate-binding protein
MMPLEPIQPVCRRLRLACWVLLGVVTAGIVPVSAVSASGSDTLVIGVRADAPPFAERRGDSGDDYHGYTVTLCRLIARRAIDEGLFCDLAYRPVTASERFAQLEQGNIQLLCGASTVTLERMRVADFSLFTFLSGASVMYRVSPAADDPEAPRSPVIGVLRGTTSDDEVRRIVGEFRAGADELAWDAAAMPQIVRTETHFEALDRLRAGEIGAYIADREILLALQQRAAATVQAGDTAVSFEVSRHYFTFEPYAIGIARDNRELRFVANLVLSELFDWESRDKSKPGIFDVLAQSFPGKRFSRSLEDLFRIQRLSVGTSLEPHPPKRQCR